MTTARYISNLRASSDIVPCSKNSFGDLSVDILDLPSLENDHEHLINTGSQHDIFLPTINLEHDLDKINQTVEGGTDIPGTEATGNTDDIKIDQTYVPESEVETENDERQNLRRSK